MQKYQLQLQDNEKRAMEQVDRYKYELSMTQSNAQDMQSGMQNEITSLRRELNDQRGGLGWIVIMTIMRMKIVIMTIMRMRIVMMTMMTMMTMMIVDDHDD